MLGQNQRKPRRQAICAPFDIPLRPRLRAGLRPPFGSGLRCCGASSYGPLRLAFGQGCARPSAWLRSALSPRPASGRAVSGGLCPPLPGPLASRSLSLGFGFCGMRGGCGAAVRPSRPAAAPVPCPPRASALALAGDRAAPSPRVWPRAGDRPLALLRIRPSGPGSRRARRPGQAAPPPV